MTVRGLVCQLCGDNEAEPLRLPPITQNKIDISIIERLLGVARKHGLILCSRCEDIKSEINEACMGGADE